VRYVENGKDVRVVMLYCTGAAKTPSELQVLVLEAEDGTYRQELSFGEAFRHANHLIFRFQVCDVRKRYHCYVKEDSTGMRLPKLPRVLLRGMDDGPQD
jgi:hypothetical protein